MSDFDESMNKNSVLLLSFQRTQLALHAVADRALKKSIIAEIRERARY
jgi:hypothetical protein